MGDRVFQEYAPRSTAPPWMSLSVGIGASLVAHATTQNEEAITANTSFSRIIKAAWQTPQRIEAYFSLISSALARDCRMLSTRWLFSDRQDTVLDAM
jgi:hypothetical protein